MLTEEEKGFIRYWEDKRRSKKRMVWQLAAGLPLGVFLAVAIYVNYVAGWFRRADMQIRVDSSGILVVMLGLLLTVIFIVVFSAKHRWDMNEQHYKELLSKKDKP